MQRALLIRPSSRTAALVGGLLLAALLLGCGSNGDSEPTPTSTALPPTPPPPTAQGESALPLERFHFVVVLTLKEISAEGEINEVVISTEGDFESPDRHAFTHSAQLGDEVVSRSIVIIGEQVWLRPSDEAWREATRDDPQVTELLATAFSPVRPGFLGGQQYQLVQESVRRLPSAEEPVNGVPANHYQVTSTGQEFFKTFLAEEQLARDVRDLRWDLWLAEDGGWPVRLRASATVISDLEALGELELQAPVSWELSIEISRPNDPTLVVAPPEEIG